METMDQTQKTLVFCATQLHALAVRDLVNQMKGSTDPSYCVRVTANDGALGEQHLRTFQDNEKTIPTILTTSQKLSTGVDARNIRNIVLMRPINSMIEFKQIIGRGTRLFEGKDYFTIYDFVRPMSISATLNGMVNLWSPYLQRQKMAMMLATKTAIAAMRAMIRMTIMAIHHRARKSKSNWLTARNAPSST